MPRYNHLVTIAFSIVSDHERGEDFTPAMLKEALFARIRDLDTSTDGVEWLEAVARHATPMRKSRLWSPIADTNDGCANDGPRRTISIRSAIVTTVGASTGTNLQRSRP